MLKINESVIFIFKVRIKKYILYTCIVILYLNASVKTEHAVG